MITETNNNSGIQFIVVQIDEYKINNNFFSINLSLNAIIKSFFRNSLEVFLGETYLLYSAFLRKKLFFFNNQSIEIVRIKH
jgi:hypothetical protein